MQRWLVLGLFAVVAFALILSLSLTLPNRNEKESPAASSSQNNPPTDAPAGSPTSLVDQKPSPICSSPPDISVGTVNGIPYYQCGPCANNANNSMDLVLLHGAAFTKEDWRASGILEQLCEQVTVYALDLPVSTNHEGLMGHLNLMRDEGILSLPVVLVTPSASGWSITSWLQTTIAGETDLLPNYVATWIPVAAGSVSSLTDSAITLGLANTPVLAIYGNQDAGGRITSERLGDLVGAQVVELVGRHPVYLDSPDEFVTTLQRFLV
jgi:pimeloyl-ACP methyl ester carboxylesterase